MVGRSLMDSCRGRLQIKGDNFASTMRQITPTGLDSSYDKFEFCPRSINVPQTERVVW